MANWYCHVGIVSLGKLPNRLDDSVYDPVGKKVLILTAQDKSQGGQSTNDRIVTEWIIEVILLGILDAKIISAHGLS